MKMKMLSWFVCDEYGNGSKLLKYEFVVVVVVVVVVVEDVEDVIDVGMEFVLTLFSSCSAVES
jgi:hypothetical protein